MKALAIVGAIVFAWIAGVGATSDERFGHIGALVFLFLAAMCGLYAWHQ